MTDAMDPAARLLELLPKDGTPRPNAHLRERLHLSESDYWLVRNQLLDEGRVTKSPGRGGRTALAVETAGEHEADVAGVRSWMVKSVFVLSGLLGLVAVGVVVWTWGKERWVWDVLTLAFGAVTVAAVGVSLLIYRVQTLASASESQGQARILKRLVVLAGDAADSASDSRELLRAIEPAVQSISATGVSPLEGGGSVEEMAREAVPAEQTEDQEAETISADHGTYYLPPTVPLQVIGDLVRWWDTFGERGRWTVSNLIGGYRAVNRSGTFVGVPWILTFRGQGGETRSFRLAYSGRRQGPAVSELTEDGIWRNFVADEFEDAE